MTAGFEPPPGDPDALDVALTVLGAILSDLETQSTRLGTGFTDALSTWRAPRAEEFGRAATGIRTRTGNARAALNGALDVLGRYAGVLRSARHDIAQLERQATHRLTSARDEVAGMDHAESPEAILTEQHAGLFVAHLVDQADGIRSHVRRVAGEAAAVLDEATGSLVPDGADLSPDTIRRQVVAASGVGDARAALAAATLTAERAWDALRSAAALAPPDGWQAWARQYGLSVPDPLDLARGLDLEKQLEAVVADSMSLPPDQRADLIEELAQHLDGDDLTSLALVDPAFVGNLDGLPNSVRYLANKVGIFHAVEGEQARLDAWQPPPTRSDVAYVDYVRLQGRIETLGKILDGAALTQGDTTTVKQVLAFTPPAYDGLKVTDDGRLALVVGDLDRAVHVGVVVPGITNRIDNVGATFGKAVNTQRLAGDDTATIAWLGYDTPEFHDAVTDEDALEGGRSLHDFLAGIRRAEGSDLTLMAHSYGTLVTAKALQLGTDEPPIPDRVVLFGSPGLGENVHSTADLGLPPGYPIYALRAPGDPVSITAAWGTDPVELPGITRLDTDWNGPEDVTGHSAYTDWGSDSLRNIVGVLDDIPPDQLHVGGNPLSDDGLLGDCNINLRNLVDGLQGQVPSSVQAAFALQIEGELSLRIETGRLQPDSPADLRALLGLVRDAAEDSGITDHLTTEELHQAIKDAGFTDTLSDQAGDAVAGWFADQDQLDGLDIPIPVGPLVRVDLHVPDELNEVLGGVLGEGTDRLVGSLSNWAVDQLPSLDTVLDVGDVVADAWATYNGVRDGVTEAWTALQATPGLIRDTGEDLLDTGAEVLDGAADVVGGAWDAATGLLP